MRGKDVTKPKADKGGKKGVAQEKQREIGKQNQGKQLNSEKKGGEYTTKSHRSRRKAQERKIKWQLERDINPPWKKIGYLERIRSTDET